LPKRCPSPDATCRHPSRQLDAPHPSTRRAAALLLVGVLALPASAWAVAPGLVLEPALATPAGASLSGRVLRAAPTHGSSPLSRNLRALGASGLPDAVVQVELLGVRAEVRTDGTGGFTAELAAGEVPFPPGVHPATARVADTVATAPVTVLDPAARFLVVSDVDDTAVETHVTSRLQLLGSALFRDGLSQRAVTGMAGWYQCLVSGKPARPGLVFVSGSPVSFVPRLRTLLLRGGFPAAALVLRPSLRAPLAAHKQAALERLAAIQTAPLLLVGDSGERDPEIYAAFRAAHPDRVLAIYIRDAGGDVGPGRLSGMTLFRSAADAAWDSAARGWAGRDCVEGEVIGAAP